MDISVVIPTMNRPQELGNCVNSLLKQTTPPSEIIIVDDGKLSLDYLHDLEKKIVLRGILYQYFLKDTPGLSVSRNKGVELSKNNAILFLDDDIILDEKYIEYLSAQWEENLLDPKFAGVGGLISNLRPFLFFENFYKKIFLLSSHFSWDINSVGYQVWNPHVVEVSKVFYLPGGVTSFRKDFLLKFPFRQLSAGRTPADDVEVFIKAKKNGYFFILEPKANLIHLEAPVARENEFLRGVKEGYNQIIIFRENFDISILSALHFFWCSIGWSLRQLLAGRILRFSGMVLGYFKGIV